MKRSILLLSMPWLMTILCVINTQGQSEETTPVYEILYVLDEQKVVLLVEGKEIVVRLLGVDKLSRQQDDAVDTSTPEIDQQKFEGVYRAAKTIEGSADVGVNFSKFIELLQSFSTEISIVKDSTDSTRETDLVEIFSEALAMYEDSKVLWEHKNKQGGTVILVEEGSLKSGYTSPLVPMIVEKYAIRKNQTGSGYAILASYSINQVWIAASRQLVEAYELYNSSGSK